MRNFDITGMSCAACSARVEKAVSKLDGVDSCSVNLLTNSMMVDGSATDIEIIAAVNEAGYGASLKGSKNQEKIADTETDTLKHRLWWSVGFLIVLMYFSMGYTMWNFPLPSYFEQNPISIGIIQLILTVIIMVINQKFFISGFKSLFKGSPNMDSLVALGSGASFIYSTYILFVMVASKHQQHFIHEFYFESAAMILTLITVGKMLEARSKGKTTNAIKSLMDMAPKTATVIRNNTETIIEAKDVKKGDIFIVRPGSTIPVDGIILEGTTAIDESALTGESIPVDKAQGDKVSAATLNKSGFIKCEATKVGEDTTLSQIIKLVSDASASKAPIAKIADKVSGIFVPIVIVIAFLATAIWLLLGQSIGFALARGISVLVISCPCALGLATPVAIMVGSGVGAKNGILFKTASSLEETGKAKIVVFDKTGTITEGTPSVTDIIPVGITENELLKIAYSIEKNSEHPLAKAIVKKAENLNLTADTVENFTALSGNGVTAVLNGKKIFGGSLKFISEQVEIPDDYKKEADTLSGQGKTPLLFADDRLLGIIAVSDTIRKDSSSAINELKNMGIQTIMLTGDNEKTANAIAKLAGIDKVIAGVLPDGKENVIKTLKETGKTIMVGDGINDAPALTRADIGIAVGAGTDIAIDAADVVLMKSNLSEIPSAIRLSKYTLRNIKQNLFWAFIYNTIGIPLAAGLLIPLGITLNPMFGAAAMSLSSFCVVTNALRLNLIKNKKEEKTMEKTVKIEGMMCPHCEARVKAILEELPEVIEATTSHEKGTAVITLSKDIPNEKLKEVIEAQGYKVLS